MTQRRTDMPIAVAGLGQSGFRMDFADCCVYVDPYLSDSVRTLEGDDFARLRAPPLEPGRIVDASWVLISHIHQDHCDPETLLPIAAASANCRFLGPAEVVAKLASLGIDRDRLVEARDEIISLGGNTTVRSVPAAHKRVERDRSGLLRFVGYVVEHGGVRYYHAGDTAVDEEVLRGVGQLAARDVAFLPVNECNFYRDRRGIIGNMSVRDAFAMAQELGVGTVVPMHYDMFAPNCVYREEIELIYRKTAPSFRLVFDPANL